ncbi:hypothetical protein U3516DRAFT_766249 [Neocallimastix sp. 'constans']
MNSSEKKKYTVKNYFVKNSYQLPIVYKWIRCAGKGELFDDFDIPMVSITGTKNSTFDLNADESCMHFIEYFNYSYKDYVNVKRGLDEYDSLKRYTIDKYLTLVSIGKRLNYLVECHHPRLKWTMNDFEININTATVNGATYELMLFEVIITTLNFDNIYESSEGRYPDNQCYYKYGYCGNGYQFIFGSCRNHYHYY